MSSAEGMCHKRTHLAVLPIMLVDISVEGGHAGQMLLVEYAAHISGGCNQVI